MITAHHYQEWSLDVRPEPGEPEWPRAQGREGEFQPTMIRLYAHTGSGIMIILSGKVIRADGTVGKRRGSTTDLPAWAAEKMADARMDRGWTADYFEQQGALRLSPQAQAQEVTSDG
jgi:hypothetical protein